MKSAEFSNVQFHGYVPRKICFQNDAPRIVLAVEKKGRAHRKAEYTRSLPQQAGTRPRTQTVPEPVALKTLRSHPKGYDSEGRGSFQLPT